MHRDLSSLSDTTFDLLVVGAGIHGAWAAWDAILRGLSVALVDRGDFGGATSANSLKIIHGGLRYLQRADLRRVRQSIRERTALARVAPHLLRPLPVLVATDRTLFRSRKAFQLAFRASEWMGWDQNRGLASEIKVPAGSAVTREELSRLFPGHFGDDVSGGAIWYDYQIQDSERLPLSLVLGAREQGGVVANYVRVDELRVRNGRVQGARVRDQLGGDEFEIRAESVLNCAGPWLQEVAFSGRDEAAPPQPASFALGINLVTRGRALPTALGFRTKSTAAEDPVCGGGRFLFAVPWRESTLFGTAYHLCGNDTTEAEVREEHLAAFVDECNTACPAFELTLDDITFFHAGRLPLKNGRERGRPSALAGASRIIDHEPRGLRGLISAEGVKYTTARGVAEKAVDAVFRKLGHLPPPSRTAVTPVFRGGDGATEDHSSSDLARLVRHAVRHEMACKLSDIVFRRTGYGAEARPPRDHLEKMAKLSGAELGWSATRREAEIADVVAAYHPLTTV